MTRECARFARSTRSSIYPCINALIIPAICDGGFCMNGGECLYPNVNCTCTEEWDGDQCDIGKLVTRACMHILHNICIIALCKEGFCMNGGNCTYPNINCTCEEGYWEGNRCQNGTPTNCTCRGYNINHAYTCSYMRE